MNDTFTLEQLLIKLSEQLEKYGYISNIKNDNPDRLLRTYKGKRSIILALYAVINTTGDIGFNIAVATKTTSKAFITLWYSKKDGLANINDFEDIFSSFSVRSILPGESIICTTNDALNKNQLILDIERDNMLINKYRIHYVISYNNCSNRLISVRASKEEIALRSDVINRKILKKIESIENIKTDCPKIIGLVWDDSGKNKVVIENNKNDHLEYVNAIDFILNYKNGLESINKFINSKRNVATNTTIYVLVDIDTLLNTTLTNYKNKRVSFNMPAISELLFPRSEEELKNSLKYDSSISAEVDELILKIILS